MEPAHRPPRRPIAAPIANEPVLAAYRTSAGRWSILAPACRDLSGRTGVHRIAALDEPAPRDTRGPIRLLPFGRQAR